MWRHAGRRDATKLKGLAKEGGGANEQMVAPSTMFSAVYPQQYSGRPQHLQRPQLELAEGAAEAEAEKAEEAEEPEMVRQEKNQGAKVQEDGEEEEDESPSSSPPENV